jgi:hypothetical protein
MNRAWFALHEINRATHAFAPHHGRLSTAGRSAMAAVIVVFASRQDRTDRAPLLRLG